MIKHIEQEITGDVLLELDVNLLKSEIGIMAFGKRMRIANAITDLRRPPSIIYSDHQVSPSSPLNPTFLQQSQPQSPSNVHSRHQSGTHSYGYTQSVQSSGHQSLNGPNGNGAPVFTSVVSPESPPHTGDFPGTPMSRLEEGDVHSDAGSSVARMSPGSEVAAGFAGLKGLGIALGDPPATNGKGTVSLLLCVIP